MIIDWKEMKPKYHRIPRYNKSHKLSTEYMYEDEILLWQQRIKECLDSNAVSETLIETQSRLVDADTKKSIRFHNDYENKIKIIVEHHKEEIRKLLAKRQDFNIKDLLKRGLNTWTVDGVNIPLNPEWKNVLVMLSGGADSACLTYNLCKIIQDNNLETKVNVVSGIRVWKSRPWAADISENVYNWLKTKFPNIISERYTHFVAPYFEHSNLGNAFDGKPGEAILLAEFIDYLCRSKKYNAVYDATTMNPQHFDGERMEVRDEDKARTNVSPKDKYWKLGPLQTTRKDWIIKQYKNNNIFDLLKITRSCEGDAYMATSVFGADWRWYEKYKDVPECGNCFWCKEKQWALKENNIEL